MDVAAEMETPPVLDKLVQISLTIRTTTRGDAALDHLIATGRPGLAGPYVRALRSNDNVIVNRAAEALGLIGDRDAIGPLIGGLVTKHKVSRQRPPRSTHVHLHAHRRHGDEHGQRRREAGHARKSRTRPCSRHSTKLAGVNFGFDQAAWRNWLSSEAKAHPVDVRRDQ